MHFRFTAQIHTFALTPSGAEGPIYTGGDGQYTAVAKSNKNKLLLDFSLTKLKNQARSDQVFRVVPMLIPLQKLHLWSPFLTVGAMVWRRERAAIA